MKSLKLEILSDRGESERQESVYKDKDNSEEKNQELSAVVSGVRRYIQENYSDMDLSLQKVSDLFNVNKTYLSKLMKEQLGYSFVEYITMIRIEKAKELLTDDILYSNIYEISNKVGFRSQHYFSRVFKKSIGISPTEYRVMKSNNNL